MHAYNASRPLLRLLALKGRAASGNRHMMTVDEMAAAFGIDLAVKQKPQADPTAPPPHGWDCEADIAAAWAHFADESNWTFTSDGGVSVYKAACWLRDRGISPDCAAEIISETIPAHPWENGHIETKVSHAYKYAQNPAGCRSVLTAIDDFNTELGDLNAYLERGFVSIGRLDPAKIQRMRWIIPGFLQCGQITLIAGQGGVGKSLHAWGVAVCVAMGLPFAWWNAPERPRRVLCLSGEDDEDEIARRVAVACKSIGRTVAELGDNFMVWRLSDIRLAIKNQLTGEVATTELRRLGRPKRSPRRVGKGQCGALRSDSDANEG
jgi:hypothetical protein